MGWYERVCALVVLLTLVALPIAVWLDVTGAH